MTLVDVLWGIFWYFCRYLPVSVTGFILEVILMLKAVSFWKRSYLLWFFITLHIMVCTKVHYIPLLCCLWDAKVLFYQFFHNSTVWSLQLYQPWGSTIWSQHTDTILHWCMPFTLLKLQVLLGKESLQCGHILSPRMFKSWDRSSVQTSCAGVLFSLCLSLSLFFFSHYILPLPLLAPSSTFQLKESKHSINNSI